MTSPTWFFDGDKRRIYEVPPGASYSVDGDGYRIYNGGPDQHPILSVDVKKDNWSRWVDWHALHDWALPAFGADGGTIRPTGENSSVDFTLRTSAGWRYVLANYPHETIFYGNLFAQGIDSLFDFSRLTCVGVVPRLQGSANLLTYSYATGGGTVVAPTAVENATALLSALVESGYSVADILRLVASFVAGDASGLESSSPQFMSLDGSKVRLKATYASGSRSMVTRDGD